MSFSFDSGVAVVLDDRIGLHFRRPHCWFALTPQDNAGRAVIANVTSVQVATPPSPGCPAQSGTPPHLLSLLLKRGDHPFITHDSYIHIAKAEVAYVRGMERIINQTAASKKVAPEEEFQIFSRMNRDLHGRIITEILDNRLTQREVKKFIRDNFGPELFRVLANCVTS